MKALSVSAYGALRKRVEQTLLLGQRKIEEAKVRTYWETGRLINQYLRKSGTPNQDHGKKIVANLSKDLGFGEKVFYRCMQFAEKFPTFAARRKLSWAHYRALVTVDDEKKRLALADEASKEAWSSRDLEIEIRNLLWDKRMEASDGKAPSLLPVPVLGSFFTYKIIKPEVVHSFSQELLIDLGFSTVLELNRISDRKFQPDTLVTSAKDSKGEYSLTGVRSTEYGEVNARRAVRLSPYDALYTYQAFVERVVDGDTLKVEIDLGFNIRIRQTIRLKGIDSPEIDTPEGKRAKKFVETLLEGVEYLTIKTIKSDKYDRYLGEVMVPKKDGSYLFLNNELLEKRQAVRVRE